MGEARGAVSGDLPRVQQLAGVDGHDSNYYCSRRAMLQLGELWRHYWVLQDGWAATPLQQLTTASGSTFHQYFGMGDDETRPDAVVFVMEFGLREASRGSRVEAAWVAKRGGAAC